MKQISHSILLPTKTVNGRLRAVAVICASLVLAACAGGGSGADTQANAPAGGPTISSYTGPAPATADVQSFKINLYDNIRGNNRCGSCHSVAGGQAPMFARSDDVNIAYAEANPVVDLVVPSDSRIVQKVSGGHNCWLSSDQACADILTTWITNWAGALATGGGRTIVLEPPLSVRDPGSSKHFPSDSSLFEATVYPLLTQYCSGCHASDANLVQSPFFAENGSPQAVAIAYEAVKPKIDLNATSSSRLVVRLRDEFHNCWTTNCTNDANNMLAEIDAFALGVPTDVVNPLFVTSKASTLYEGTIASGGNRYEANVIALYEFKTGQGLTAFDASGVDPALDLTLSGSVDWFGGWGLNFSGGKAQASPVASAKLATAIQATGEYTIEAWVAPGNVVQDDTRIVSYSGSDTSRNFNLGQTMYNYDFFNRTSTSDANGNPQLSTPDAAEVLQATLQHVVVNFDPVAGRTIYVNGILVSAADTAPGGSLASWQDNYAFVLGNEVSGALPWTGVIRLVAIHNRLLTPAQILQNYEAGVGEKFFVMFGVEHQISVPESYIVFEAAQYDSYGYLFRNPFFISLDGAAQPNGIDIQGLRIGINGQEAPVGQAFANLSTAVSTGAYDPATGQSLQTLGTVLPLERGPDSDEFFLTFDLLGGRRYSRPIPTTPPPATPQDLAPRSDIGVRTFDEINATLSTITGVPMSDPTIEATYDQIRQSLPTVEDVEAFLSSHQMAIAQLSILYCAALIDDTTLRTDPVTGFPGFPFTSNVATAYPASQDLLIDPLLDRVLGTTANFIGTQPDRATVKTELEELINGIPTDATRSGLANGGGDQIRTRTIAKSVCAALLGSAAMLVQ
jgi:mono/diheme cytochrome c family protein